jgi:serine-type D-Ala-D-Ala carboxypeptidase (penicillin-binding protein 5/6)
MVVILSVLLALTGVTTLFVQRTYAESQPSIDADAAIVVSASTGEEVYSLHKDRKLSPGSLTKLMVAMVVVDQMHDQSEYKNKITITAKVDKLGDIYNQGDRITVRDLMASLLMEDSDEAALALALYSSGSRGKFIQAMNARAQELGLENTHYTNVTGRVDTLQYSTAEDSAAIIQEALTYSTIEKYLTADTYAMESKATSKTATLQHQDTFQYRGLTLSLQAKLTSGAAYNSMALATRDGMKLLTVILGTPKAEKNDVRTTLLDYGYRNVTMQTIVKQGKQMGKIKIRHGARTRIPVYTETKGYVYVPEEGSDSLIRTETVIYKKLKAPVKAGTKAGEYRIYVADKLTGTVDLVVKEDVETGWFPSYIYISNTASIVILVVLTIVLALVARIIQVKRRRKKKAMLRRKRRAQEIARRELEMEEDRRRRNWTYR